jgi:hypothetical protein
VIVVALAAAPGLVELTVPVLAASIAFPAASIGFVQAVSIGSQAVFVQAVSIESQVVFVQAVSIGFVQAGLAQAPALVECPVVLAAASALAAAM